MGSGVGEIRMEASSKGVFLHCIVTYGMLSVQFIY